MQPGSAPHSPITCGTAGTANTGGGGGSGAERANNTIASGKNGGSGIVITRFPSAATLAASPGCNTVTTAPCGAKLATFNVTGTLTVS